MEGWGVVKAVISLRLGTRIGKMGGRYGGVERRGQVCMISSVIIQARAACP